MAVTQQLDLDASMITVGVPQHIQTAIFILKTCIQSFYLNHCGLGCANAAQNLWEFCTDTTVYIIYGT